MLSSRKMTSSIMRAAMRPTLATRAFATAPGVDPLDYLRETSVKRNLCDESGYRLPGVHWTMSVAFASDDPMQVCNEIKRTKSVI
jgi:hypothetical protein